MPTIANTLTITGTPLVTSAAASMVIQQTGDTFGTTKMSLLNRTGINGPLFENLGLDLVDFGMKPSTGIQCVIRNAHSASFQMDATNNPAGELQFQFDSLTGGGKNPWVFGEAITAMAGRLQFGTLNPGSFPANRDVGLARNAAGVLEVNSGTAGTFKDLKCDRINAVTGYQINGAAIANKILKANGTNFVASTETMDAPGTAGSLLVSDGTNWKSKIDILTNSSTSAQGGAGVFSGDTYLVGSGITIPVGGWTAGTTYKCRFDMSKTAAGTANLLLNVRIGTTGTTADAAVLAYNSGLAQTVNADQATFEILLTIRTLGASAAIICAVNIYRINATAVGFAALATPCIISAPTATTTFNSTTATKIGVSFNGGTSFVGTSQQVIAELNIQ